MTTKEQENKINDNSAFEGAYHYGVGRRKAAVAQVRVYCNDDTSSAGKAIIMVNGRKYDEYFHTNSQKDEFLEPLKVAGLDEKCSVSVLVKGGGISGQAGAARLGIARALVKYDADLRPVLKAQGMLTRDARKVERKKPGLRKARRSPQWSKR